LVRSPQRFLASVTMRQNTEGERQTCTLPAKLPF
jgi:hypothetical protein